MTIVFALTIGLAVFVTIPGSPKQTLNPVFEESYGVSTSELIDAIRMCVQSGLSLAQTFALLARCKISHLLISQAQSNVAVGLPVMHGTTEVSDDHSIRMLVMLLQRNAHTGSSIDQSLFVLSQQIRADIHAQRIKRIRAVAVKSVLPLGLCFLPAFILLGVVPIAVSLGSTLLG